MSPRPSRQRPWSAAPVRAVTAAAAAAAAAAAVSCRPA
jgi:hypothetical protein